MKQKQKIQQAIQNWFIKHKRDLPWRKDRSWYRVWISEIMLQQTRVDQAINYYNQFLKFFPEIESLANANLQDVLKSWEGMGYYSRAHNLYKTAKIIVDQYDGNFPDTKEEIIKLPGIGEYTAHAILSFVFNKPFSVVDGNVIRVLARLFAITDNVNDNHILKQIKSKAKILLPLKKSAVFNEAIMELGALICVPKNPKCTICPVNTFCESHQEDLVDMIPFKSKKKSKPEITAISQIAQKNNKYIIAKRKDKGLLGGFWEFPMDYMKGVDLIENEVHNKLNKIKHSYTHFNLQLIPVFVQKENLKLNNKLYVEKKWVKIDEIQNYPIHRAMQKVLESIEKI